MKEPAVERDAVIPVRLHGQLLFWLKDPDGSGPLSPREHLTETGRVRGEVGVGSLFSTNPHYDSYAHVFEDGTIMRYGEKIATVDDLEFVPAPKDMQL